MPREVGSLHFVDTEKSSTVCSSLISQSPTWVSRFASSCSTQPTSFYTMTDPFYRLPIDILLLLMNHFLDLSSLSFLIQASPAAADTFAQCSNQIIRAAIRSGLFPPLPQLIRAIIAVRSGDSVVKLQQERPEVLDEFLDFYVYGDAGSRPLPRISASFTVLRSILDLASDIECLAQSFLDTHLNRVNNIRPSTPADSRFGHCSDPWSYYPEGHEYQPAKCGPPSWVEKHRVLRALWRLQLYYDLVPFLGSDNGLSRVWIRLRDYEIDEMDAVLIYIHEIQSTSSLSWEEHHSSHAKVKPRLPKIKPTGVIQFWKPEAPSADDKVASARQQVVAAADFPSPGYNFFQRPCLHMPWSPLKQSSFRPFQRLGFGIWDLQKMGELGMLHPPRELNPETGKLHTPIFNKRPSVNELIFRWRSVRES